MDKIHRLCLDATLYTASPFVPKSHAHSICQGSVSIPCERPNDDSVAIAMMQPNPVGHTVFHGQHGGSIECSMMIFCHIQAVSAFFFFTKVGSWNSVLSF